MRSLMPVFYRRAARTATSQVLVDIRRVGPCCLTAAKPNGSPSPRKTQPRQGLTRALYARQPVIERVSNLWSALIRCVTRVSVMAVGLKGKTSRV